MIAVNCAFDKMVPLAELRPNPKNCNRHSEYQLGLLAKVMQAHGWRAPITVSNLSGLIIRGHGRLAAAQLAGETEAPVDFQNYASEQQEIEDMLADNRLGELAEMDNTALSDLLRELGEQDIDLELAGFDDNWLTMMGDTISNTSTDRAGQGVSSTLQSMKESTDHGSIQIGDMTINISRACYDLLIQALESGFDSGISYSQTFEGIINAELNR